MWYIGNRISMITKKIIKYLMTFEVKNIYRLIYLKFKSVAGVINISASITSFSAAVIRHHEQGNFQRKSLFWF